MGQVHSSDVYNHAFFDGWSQAQKDEFLLAPAMAAPAKTLSNFENPPNRTKLGVVVTTVFLVLTVLCFLVRAYSRIMILRRVKVEDGICYNPLTAPLVLTNMQSWDWWPWYSTHRAF
jgi:hypothetical protein